MSIIVNEINLQQINRGYWEIFLFFLIIAFEYSSVGFGGSSIYLAVLAMYSLPYQEIRLTALICNVIVIIAFELGFQNFSHLFKVKTGSTPKNYRKKLDGTKLDSE